MVYLGFIDDKRASDEVFDLDGMARLLNEAEHSEVDRVRRLFPEAEIVNGGIFTQESATEFLSRLAMPGTR